MKCVQIKLIWKWGHILQKCKSCEVTTGAFLAEMPYNYEKNISLLAPQ